MSQKTIVQIFRPFASRERVLPMNKREDYPVKKVEQKIVDAVRAGLDLTIGNTSVWFLSSSETGNPFGPRSEVFLHNYLIATFWHNSGQLEVNRDALRQWPTATTKSRLRALGAKVETRKGVVYLNGEAL